MMELTERVQTALQASVVFLDIIGYSKRAVAEQFDIKKLFNADVAYAIAPIPQDGRLLLDTGDGAALCFFGEPIDALTCATRLSTRFAAASSTRDARFEVRTGVNLGPARVIRDMNGQLNVIGDAINDGQRIMSFAGPGQVLVSRAFRDSVCALHQHRIGMFEYVGVRADKHGKEHVLYELLPGAPQSGTTKVLQSTVPAERVRSRAAQDVPASSQPGQQPSSVQAPRISSPFATRGQGSGWVPGVLEAVTRQLDRYLGSSAGELVRRAAAQARNVDALYALLATHLGSDADRAAFIDGKEVVLRLLAQRRSAQPASEPTPSQSPAAGDAWMPSQELLDATTSRLSRFVGGLAGALVRQAARHATSESDFFLRCAMDIKSDDDQIRFMDEVRDGRSRRI